MAQTFEAKIATDVANIAEGLNYKVTHDPTHLPNQGSWANSLGAIVRTHKYRPDILIENADSFVIVEVKTRPVLLGGITQAKNYKQHFKADVILCVPDDSFSKTPESVKGYAIQQGIHLCPISEVARILKELLGEVDYIKRTGKIRQ